MLVSSHCPKARLNDADRFRGAYQAHAGAVRALLHAQGLPAADVDDAAQQAFMVFAQRMADVPPDKERAFLRATARRVGLSLRRVRARRREVFGIDRPWPANGDGPERRCARRCGQRLLEGLLSRLSHDCRRVFCLYEIEQLSMVEIAQRLAIPTGTVASRLRRARGRFTAELQRMRLAGKLPLAA